MSGARLNTVERRRVIQKMDDENVPNVNTLSAAMIDKKATTQEAAIRSMLFSTYSG